MTSIYYILPIGDITIRKLNMTITRSSDSIKTVKNVSTNETFGVIEVSDEFVTRDEFLNHVPYSRDGIIDELSANYTEEV